MSDLFSSYNYTENSLTKELEFKLVGEGVTAEFHQKFRQNFKMSQKL